MLIGHKKIWQSLQASYKADRLAHGYLFFGEDSLGKKRLAKEFIKFLNCTGENPPCQNCRSCKEIEKDSYPDFSLIEPLKPSSANATTGKQEIQIAQIRELKYSLTLKTYEGKYKSVIINEAQSLNQEAYSCLLKTLEEPLGKAIMILISQARESLPKTILSRVESIKFQKTPTQEIENYFISQGLADQKAKELAQVADGRPGIALNYFNDPEKIKNDLAKIEDIVKIKKSSLTYRFQYIKDLTEGEQVVETLRTWMGFFRDAMLFKIGVKNENQIYKNFYKEVEDLNVVKLKDILKKCEELNLLLTTTNVNQKLALETLMIEI
jgi:DNA polymerase-3 subunit delta'